MLASSLTACWCCVCMQAHMRICSVPCSSGSGGPAHGIKTRSSSNPMWSMSSAVPCRIECHLQLLELMLQASGLSALRVCFPPECRLFSKPLLLLALEVPKCCLKRAPSVHVLVLHRANASPIQQVPIIGLQQWSNWNAEPLARACILHMEMYRVRCWLETSMYGSILS